MRKPKPFEPFVIAEAVKARIRRDGGPLVRVIGKTKDGRPFEGETLCPQDGAQQLRELKFNGWTDLEIVKVR
jgi:hypothetical protein